MDITNKYAFLLICIGIVLSISSCNHQPAYRYSKYASETDTALFTKGIDGLTDLLLNSPDYVTRYVAAEELAKYALNPIERNRDILRDRSLPALIDALEREEEDDVRSRMIETIQVIKPDKDLIIPVYLEILDEKPNSTTIWAALSLIELGYDRAKVEMLISPWLDDENAWVRHWSKMSLQAINNYLSNE